MRFGCTSLRETADILARYIVFNTDINCSIWRSNLNTVVKVFVTTLIISLLQLIGQCHTNYKLAAATSCINTMSKRNDYVMLLTYVDFRITEM